MTQKEKLAALRREVDELKQRVALLEARPQWNYTFPVFSVPTYPTSPTVVPYSPTLPSTTCSSH